MKRNGLMDGWISGLMRVQGMGVQEHEFFAVGRPASQDSTVPNFQTPLIRQSINPSIHSA